MVFNESLKHYSFMSKFDRNDDDDDLTSLQSDDASLKNLIELVNKMPTRFSLLIRLYLI